MGVFALTKKMKTGAGGREEGKGKDGWKQQKDRKVSFLPKSPLCLKGQMGCTEALRASVWRQAEPGTTRTRIGKGVYFKLLLERVDLGQTTS